ncbi:MAG: hypothetical protein V1832_00885 [Nitrospirota bacterium]|jgi:hypothetical protein
MVKKLTKKLKDVELEITFVEPKEYDTVKGGDTGKKKDNKRKKVRAPKKKRKSRMTKHKK